MPGTNISIHRHTLQHLAGSGNSDVVRLLLERGEDLEAKMDNHSTPLHIAVENRKVAAVRSLLDHGANVQARRNDLLTPMRGASWSGNPNPDVCAALCGAWCVPGGNDGHTV